MGFIKLNCSNCGANIELDESREFGFCQYCGTKMVQDKIIIEHRGSVSIDRTAKIQNLLIRAKEMISQNRIDEAEKYYDRVLEYDIRNTEARSALDNIIYKVIKEPNITFFVSKDKLCSKDSKVSILINGQKKGYIIAGDNKSFLLPVGENTVTVSLPFVIGTKKQIRIIINNRFDKYRYELKCKIRNTIEITEL